MSSKEMITVQTFGKTHHLKNLAELSALMEKKHIKAGLQ